MRAQDVAELKAAGIPNLVDAVAEGVRTSDWSVAARVDGKLACIFGIRGYTLLGDIGVPWMLGTEELVHHHRALVRLTPRYIGAMLQAYPRLMNAVHDRNTVSKGWLRALGFTIGPPLPVGADGERFCVFEMKRG